jgi:hypothetical protein
LTFKFICGIYWNKLQFAIKLEAMDPKRLVLSKHMKQSLVRCTLELQSAYPEASQRQLESKVQNIFAVWTVDLITIQAYIYTYNAIYPFYVFYITIAHEQLFILKFRLYIVINTAFKNQIYITLRLQFRIFSSFYLLCKNWFSFGSNFKNLCPFL